MGPALESFRIETMLGNGSFGEVYRCVGTKSGTVAAVKMVPQHKLTDPSTLSIKTVLNEARVAMLQVNHPNVVRVLHVDTGSDSGVGPYVMMEYVEGGNLQDLITRTQTDGRQLTLDEAISLMRGIALGAQAINEHLVHRDMKPDNILLDGPSAGPIPGSPILASQRSLRNQPDLRRSRVRSRFGIWRRRPGERKRTRTRWMCIP